MALTIAQITDFRTVVPSDVGSDLGIRRGYHITNGTRSGEGMVVDCVQAGFTPNIWSSITIVVLSGDFQNSDSCTTANGGSFTIKASGGVTLAAHPGIVVTGTMSDTDTTRNTNEALDATEEEITVTSTTGIAVRDILRIDDTVDEYVYVTFVNSSTSLQVKRGLFGTAGTHDTNKDIYKVDTNLFEQILDADVGGGWGYSTTSNGRIQLDCHILLGRTDISSNCIFISCNELVDISATNNNSIQTYGDYTTYKTHFQMGKGFISPTAGSFEGFGCLGSKVIGANAASGAVYFYPLKNNPKTVCYFYNSSLVGCPNPRGAIYAWNFTIDADLCFFEMVSGETSKMFNIFIPHCAFDIASEELTIKGLYQWTLDTAFYWVATYGPATLTNMESNPDNGGTSGFLGSGTKTLIDCKTDADGSIFWGSGTFNYYKTFNCNVTDEQKTAIQDATVLCKYHTESTAQVFKVQTDSNGDIAEQQVLFHSYESGGSGTSTPNIEYFVYKNGYEPVYGRLYLEKYGESVSLTICLKKDRSHNQHKSAMLARSI